MHTDLCGLWDQISRLLYSFHFDLYKKILFFLQNTEDSGEPAASNEENPTVDKNGEDQKDQNEEENEDDVSNDESNEDVEGEEFHEKNVIFY